MKKLKFILSGGGTGGHIYPAIAIADELKARHPNAEFLFVGADDRMEMEKVPEAGYKIIGLSIAGLQRKLTLKNLLVPFKLIKSLRRSKKIVKDFNPDVVIGTGGYASAPLLKAANQMGVPTLIQEQNAFPGKTNKWLSKGASKICVAYADMERFFPKEKLVFTGNPIRKRLLEIDSKRKTAQEKFDLDKNKLTVLVLGGSLGAKVINERIGNSIEFFKKKEIQLIWQCGKLYYNKFKDYAVGNTVQVMPFLNNMDEVYAAADIIISRAGAIAVSELTVVGKPVIFIPSPNVAEDHQTKNAMAMVRKRAAMIIPEAELDQQFEEKLSFLLKDKVEQDLLGRTIKSLSKPEATEAIVDEVENLLNK